MPSSTSTANSILDLIFLAAAWADVAQNDGSSPATTLDVALHTAAPASSLQTSNEATYGSYARASVSRNGTGWSTASGGSNASAALIQFPEAASGTNVVTHISIGISGTIILSGALASSRTITTGIQPQFAAGTLVNTVT